MFSNGRWVIVDSHCFLVVSAPIPVVRLTTGSPERTRYRETPRWSGRPRLILSHGTPSKTGEFTTGSAAVESQYGYTSWKWVHCFVPCQEPRRIKKSIRGTDFFFFAMKPEALRITSVSYNVLFSSMFGESRRTGTKTL